jgi:pSer/pThr/pTyr-binding forkhead associated (FHA) protein
MAIDGVPTVKVTAKRRTFILGGVLSPAPPSGADMWGSLHLLDYTAVIVLKGKLEFVVGRSESGQTVAPDIDLTRYEAYKNGVSRLHANVSYFDGFIFIEDLYSSNGTYVANRRLLPFVPHRVGCYEEILLGKLRIQVLARERK